ncbi:MAG TPA: hypothetical protein VG929_12090 [Actinomycetota bacterium]|nr:hypothetical protein [Actinomycetota bacterium]
MSVVAPSPRLGWRLLPAVVAAAAAVVAASLAIAAVRDHPAATAVRRAVAGRPVTAAVVAKPWRIATFSVGATVVPERLSRPARRRLEAQKPRVRRVARAVAHAVTLAPPDGPAGVGRFLTAAAARSFARTAPGLPKNARDVTAFDRFGRIGLQAPRFDTAVAHLHVKTRALVGERRARWNDTVTLWLTRRERAWKVIAFDIDRRPR